MSYTKLFSHIVRSTVWAESAPTRCVWVTMLAVADRRGNVMGSVPGLSRESNVSLEECVEALRCLLSPDKWSRNKAFEGRRIAEIEGGWLIINYEKHREARDLEHENELARERMAKLRARKATKKRNKANSDVPLPAVTVGSTTSTSPSTNEQPSGSIAPAVDPSVAAPAEPAPPTPEPDPDAKWSRDACDLWIARFGGTVTGGKLGAALKPLVGKHGWRAVRPAWIHYLSVSEALYASAARFAETFVDWRRAAGGEGQGEAAAQPSGQGNGHPPREIGPGSPEAVQLWDNLAEKLKLVVAPHNYGTWVRPIRGLRLEDGAEGAKVLVIVVPTPEWKEHLRGSGYIERMRIAAEGLGHRGMLFKAVVQASTNAVHDGSIR